MVTPGYWPSMRRLPLDPPAVVPGRPGALGPTRNRPRWMILVLAALGALGGAACAQDTSEGTVEPADAEPGPAEQPGGGGDPTLSGEEGTPGVGGGVGGGDG